MMWNPPYVDSGHAPNIVLAPSSFAVEEGKKLVIEKSKRPTIAFASADLWPFRGGDSVKFNYDTSEAISTQCARYALEGFIHDPNFTKDFAHGSK